MIPTLFTASTRFLSRRSRKMITRTSRDGKPICRSALCLYIQQNYTRGSHQTSFEAIRALQKKFKELPKETVKQLQNAVAKNKEVLKHRKAVILTSNTRPYSVFVKENYRLLPESVREKGIRATAKALSEKWKRMSELQKQGYTKKADAIRKGASEKRKEMVKNYFS
mmetsp:Transcript_40031/g.63285  ORF Transcript_40031/g.63285 Transcript_40031/m.63285 type:complete len:167 (-) Transcript_40031:50-550(-)